MPIYDYVCEKCKKEKRDEFVKQWCTVVLCECGNPMIKKPSMFNPDTFPADGIFLEHVSAQGKRFYSKREMKDYAKEHDLQLGALE